MTALWLHIRTTPLRWVVPPLAVFAVLVLLLRPRYWIGIWPETGAAAQIPAFFLSIIAAGGAAWISGSRKRHRLEEQTAAAAVTTATSEAFRMGTTAIMFTIPYLVGHVVAFALTIGASPPGFTGIALWFLYALMGFAVILFSVAWGWTFGRLFGPLYASLVALLSWFAFESFAGDAVGLSVLSGPAWQQPSLDALLIRLAGVGIFWAGLLWASPRLTERQTDWKITLAPLAGAVAAIVAVTSTSGVSDRDPPSDPLCIEGEIEICLWPEDAKYASLVGSLDGRVATLPKEFQLPSRLIQYGLERTRIDYNGQTFIQLEGDFDISEGQKGALALGLSDAIIATTLQSCDWEAIWQAEDLAPEALRRWVELYLIESSTPSYGTFGESSEIQEAWSIAGDIYTELPESQQRDWVHEELESLAENYCS